MILVTKESYERMTRSLRNHPRKVQALRTLNKVLTVFVYCAYPTLLLVLALQKDERIWRVLIIPAISFILVSLFRKYFNQPRPYEVLNIKPLIHKETKGKSFPSRHVFSIFVIAMAFYYISYPMGLILLLMGVLLAIIRVIGGVHFPRDVIVGAIIGIVSWGVGVYLIQLQLY